MNHQETLKEGITERKRVEEALRESEVNFRTFFETIDDLIVVATPEGRILFTNTAFQQKLGYRTDELTGMHLLDMHPAQMRRQAEENFTAMFRGERKSSPLPVAAKSGALVPAETRFWAGRWDGADCIFGISKDLSAQQEAQQQFERLFRSNPTPMALSTLPERQLTDVNDAFLEVLGYSRDEVIGKTSAELGLFPNPEHRAAVADTLQKDGRVADLELQIRCKDGAILDGLLSGEIISSQGRQHFLTVMINITRRKQAEEALKKSEEMLRLITENMSDMIRVTDLQGTNLYVSPSHVKGLGYAMEERLGKSALDIVHPDDIEMIVNKLTQGLASNQPVKVEYRVRHADGHYLWLDTVADLLRDAQGKETAVVMSSRNISNGKQAEEALRKERQRLAGIIEATHVGTWEWNVQTGETVFNDRWAEIIGCTLEELSPLSIETWMKFAHPDDLKASDDLIEKHFRGELDYYEFESRMKHKDGSWVWVLDRGKVTAWTEEGKPLLMQGTHQDITDRKRAETELQDTNRNLEEATTRANDMAAQAGMANAAKSEFLANMSHEIRTPMNGVIGMTGLLLDTELSKEQRKYAEIVKSSSESLLALLNDILDFSKIEAGKLEMETLDFDLRSLLDDFATMTAVRAQDKGIEFICAAAPDVPACLRGDPGRLRQILTNLAGNAVKFTHRGEIAVRASLASETDTEAILRFSIKDTGIGIPEEKQGLLFQKFTQADASTTRQYGGTGLGLAISKQLVERMGGEIGLISEEGRGSEFWFTVRLDKRAEREHSVVPPADIRGVHVLVVDDNTTNREVLIAQFKAWGVRAEETADAPAALQALCRARDAGDPFRAAILDMQMPGMDGATLAATIKSDETLKGTQLVLMTSLGQRGDAKRMEAAGFSAYLTKPARQSELFGCLSVVLAGTDLAKPAQPIVTRHMIRELSRGVVRILLAEDNITNQQVALGILKKLGLRADAVANGAEAVKALEALPYDLVLMDVQMPEMDGLSATQQIRDPRSAVRNHRIPIIAMTAHALEGDRERCLEAGMNDYVPKPVDPQALMDVLDRWLPKEAEAAAYHMPGATEITAPASGPERETPVFDRKGMMARMMDDGELSKTVAEGFLEDIPQRIEALWGYLATGDVQGAVRQAHTIKGACANVGGERLRAVAFAMEQAGKAGDMGAFASRMTELETQFDTLRQVMEKHFSLS